MPMAVQVDDALSLAWDRVLAFFVKGGLAEDLCLRLVQAP
ncbi:MAG: hypothetical protein ACI9ZD_001047 [Paracoccaceae bacterium]|jgi:hypothetical protein